MCATVRISSEPNGTAQSLHKNVARWSEKRGKLTQMGYASPKSSLTPEDQLVWLLIGVSSSTAGS